MLTPPPRGVLCSGNISLDILVRPVDDLSWGRTMWVESMEQQMGGNGSNTSYTLAMMGVPVRLLGMVGNDDFGEWIVAILKRAGVDLSALGRSRAPTTATTCLIDSKGERMFLHRLGSSREAFAEPIDFEAAARDGISHYHMANPFALPNLRRDPAAALRRARQAGLTTSFDTAWDARGEWMQVVGPCLPHVDLFFMNHDEARMLTGTAEPLEAARRLQDLGARDVVVKLGGRGCAIVTREGMTCVPAFDVEVIDTTGAGDSFVGGFLAELYRASDYAAAARFANATGAFSVRSLGAVTGIRGYEETRAWMLSARTRQ